MLTIVSNYLTFAMDRAISTNTSMFLFLALIGYLTLARRFLPEFVVAEPLIRLVNPSCHTTL